MESRGGLTTAAGHCRILSCRWRAGNNEEDNYSYVNARCRLPSGLPGRRQAGEKIHYNLCAHGCKALFEAHGGKGSVGGSPVLQYLDYVAAAEVIALGRRVAPPGTIDVGPQFGLPPLPSRDVMLYSNLTDRQARSSLRTLSAAVRSTAN
jgi:hypothetical protein